jgi:ABC-type sugar transport system ATPase subunit
VRDAAALLGIDTLLQRRPKALSGGQRQRVAVGRAIVREPKAFLLDEPLSNLDAKLRVQTRSELARLHRQLGATMLFVTHDQEEAMTLGDRIAVLFDGQLQQVGSPMEVYERPANSFVAGFIGSPAMNFLPCTVRRDAAIARLQGPGFDLDVPFGHDSNVATDTSLLLGVRPHDIRLVAPLGADVCGRIEMIEPLGHERLIHLAVQGTVGDVALRFIAEETAVAVNDRVAVRFDRHKLYLFDAATTRRIEWQTTDSR